MKSNSSMPLAVLCFLTMEVGCTAIGHNIDKKFDTPSSNSTSIPTVVMGIQSQAFNPQYKPFSELGTEIDASIVKAVITRRKENDMAWRDAYSLCPQGQTRACSITTGCECKEN